jgi:hypothetical protein
LNLIEGFETTSRSHLKNRILAQGQGGAEFQPAGILKYVEELKRGPNTEIGKKDFFEIASIKIKMGRVKRQVHLSKVS